MSIDYNICFIIIGNVLVFIIRYMLCREHDGNCLRFVLFQHHLFHCHVNSASNKSAKRKPFEELCSDRHTGSEHNALAAAHPILVPHLHLY